ncbi:MAG: IclR family transcriptional regulator [Anaerolineaceae bacterium]
MPSESSSTLQHITAVLDSFSASQPELGVREVARLTNLSPSTAGRLMLDLKDAGILQQNPTTRAYSLGSKILVWAGVYTSTLDLRTVALPYMEDLRQKTGETISLYLLDGMERLCIERMESHHTVRMVPRLGKRLPLHAGSGGKAMLAFLPEAQIEAILNQGNLTVFTAATMVDPQALCEELKKVRQKGYAVSVGEWLTDASGVATPIFGRTGDVIGAVSISGPTSRLTSNQIEEYADALLHAADEISLQLGYTGEKISTLREEPHEY